MTGFDFGGLLAFWARRYDDILGLVAEHIVVVAVALVFATIIGVGVGLLVWSNEIGRSLAVTSAAVILTIPSLALLAVMIPLFGLGWTPTLIGLTLYSLLPIIRASGWWPAMSPCRRRGTMMSSPISPARPRRDIIRPIR